MQIQIGNIQFRAYISKLEKRTGICSQKQNSPDKHCLLWDFDDADLKDIVESLTIIQKSFNLPSILILESSPDKYHAYCFTSRSLRETICILAATPEIDVDYLRIGATRGYYTLRISARAKDKIKPHLILYSMVSNEMTPYDMTVNEYWTSNTGVHNNE